MKNKTGQWKRIFACVMAMFIGISCIMSINSHAELAEGGAKAAVEEIYVHCRASGIKWTPLMDVSDEYMKEKIDFYVNYKNNLVNDVIGDSYTIVWYNEEGEALSGIPSDAGKYTVRIVLDESLAGKVKFAEGKDSFNYKISQMNLAQANIGFYGKTDPVWTGEQVMCKDYSVGNSSYTLPKDTYELQFVEGKNCIEPGTGYVKLVGKGPNVYGEKELTYSIGKVNLKTHPEITSFYEEIQTEFEYDGTGKKPEWGGVNDLISSVECFEYRDSNNIKLKELPSDAGTYTCYMKVTASDAAHYNSFYYMQEYTIIPRVLEADTEVEKSKVYDTSVSVKSPKVTIKNLVEGDDVKLWAGAVYDSKNAGKNKVITVSYTMTGQDVKNYVLPDKFTIEDGEIIPKEVTVENIVLQSYFYNGSKEVPLDETTVTNMDHWVLTAYVAVDDIALDISEIRAFMETADAGENKSVTFTGLKLTGEDSGNYTLVEPKSSVTVRKKEFSNGFWVEMPDYEYGTTVPKPVLLRYEGDGDVTYKYRKYGSEGEYLKWENIEPETLKPGAYEIIAEVTGTVNYDGGITLYPQKFNVNKLSPNLRGTEKYEKKYGDGSFYLDVISDGDAQLKYSVFRGENVLSVDEDGKVTIKNAGEGVILVKSEETELYRYGNILINVSVAKIKGSCSVSIEGWEYSPDNKNFKSPVPVSDTNGTDNVTYYYKLRNSGDDSYSKEIPTDAGEYTVKAVFAETENYQELTATADFEITKKNNPENMPENGSMKIEAAGSKNLLKDISLPEGWSWKKADMELPAGGIITVEAVYMDTVNYENYSMSIEISIKAEIISSATDYEYVIGTDTKAVIKCTGELSLFKGMEIDGTPVNPSCYLLEEGSTIIILQDTFLNTLSVGTHKVTLSYPAGDVETTLEIREKQREDESMDVPAADTPNHDINTSDSNTQKNPETGDVSITDMYILIFVFAGIISIMLLAGRQGKPKKLTK